MIEGSIGLNINKFPVSLHARAKQAALDRGISMAELVRRAVSEYLGDGRIANLDAAAPGHTMPAANEPSSS